MEDPDPRHGTAPPFTETWYRTHKKGAIRRAGPELTSERLGVLPGNLEILVVSVVETPRGRRGRLVTGGWVSVDVLLPLDGSGAPSPPPPPPPRGETGSWSDWVTTLTRTLSGGTREASASKVDLARTARARLTAIGVARRRPSKDAYRTSATVLDLKAATRYYEYLDDDEKERLDEMADTMWTERVPSAAPAEVPAASGDGSWASPTDALRSLAEYLGGAGGRAPPEAPSADLARTLSESDRLSQRRGAARAALSGHEALAWRVSQDAPVAAYLGRAASAAVARRESCNGDDVEAMELVASLRRCGALSDREPLGGVRCAGWAPRISGLRSKSRLMLRRFVNVDRAHRAARDRGDVEDRRSRRAASLRRIAEADADAASSDDDSEEERGAPRGPAAAAAYAKPRPAWPARIAITSSRDVADRYAAASKNRLRPASLKRSVARRIWCVSDLHVDVGENMRWLRKLPARPSDAVIVAGDVCACVALFREAMEALKAKFADVFFVPGNHDLWIEPGGAALDCSVRKLFQLLYICDELGVLTTPALLADGALVVPLFSWYDAAFGSRGGGGGGDDSARKLAKNFDALCAWPAFLRGGPGPASPAIDALLTSLNARHLEVARRVAPNVLVSFSHFVPRASLFPGFRCFLPVMGSSRLSDQIDALHPHVHCFGHSHLDVDDVIDGTRFVQNAVGLPSERAVLDAVAPILVYDADWACRDLAEPPAAEAAAPLTATQLAFLEVSPVPSRRKL